MAQKILFSAEILVFCIGLLSNSLALVTLIFGKRLNNIGTKNMYIYLIIIDTLFLFIMIFDRGLFYNGFDFITFSIWSCRLYPYFNRILATLSPMLLVFISVERYVSLQDLSKQFMLRKSTNQLFYLIATVAFNCVYYLPCVIYFEIIMKSDYNSSNKTLDQNFTYETKCLIVDENLEVILPIMDLLNRVIIPCILMLTASFFLIRSVHKLKLENVYQADEHSRREVKLTITSICLNLIYVFLTLPLPVVLLFGNYVHEFVLFSNFYLFCLSYSLNFYVLLLMNSLFRTEFLNLFKKLNFSSEETYQVTYRINFV